MNKDSNLYTFVFAALVCIVCSFLLSMASMGLKDKQDFNRKLDKRKNILKALNLLEPDISGERVLEIFKNRVKDYVLDKHGNFVPGVAADSLSKEDYGTRFALYGRVENGQIVGYAVPVMGKGLWGQVKGFLALSDDLNQVQGITFYEHKETPGLGAEIQEDNFTSKFKGKKIRDNLGNLVSIKVAKGKVSDAQVHEVDGISGATLTCDCVTELLKKSLNDYEPFFTKVRKGEVKL